MHWATRAERSGSAESLVGDSVISVFASGGLSGAGVCMPPAWWGVDKVPIVPISSIVIAVRCMVVFPTAD